MAGMEALFRSTKVRSSASFGLWPKLFSDTSNAEPGLNSRLAKIAAPRNELSANQKGVCSVTRDAETGFKMDFEGYE